ncbi:hypothetical protein CK203_116557 [Vitis vinifera]|uniref:Uncharacterized protein n=1 Tax=Vitis vinifera TaxID=29760 RepID=A0A438CP62_VITVI|nr:hypothetical protein CK203_116557 [Vitis vinifera]
MALTETDSRLALSVHPVRGLSDAISRSHSVPEPHSSYAFHQYRPRTPRPAYDQTHMPQTLVLPSYATQGIERPAVSYTPTGQPCYAAQHADLRRLIPDLEPSRLLLLALRTQRQFSQIGMPLSQALRKLTEAGY